MGIYIKQKEFGDVENLDRGELEQMIEFFASEVNKYNLKAPTSQQKHFVERMLQAHSHYQKRYIQLYGHEHQVKRQYLNNNKSA